MELFSIGVVRRAHGIHGELKVESLSGESDHFKRLNDVQLCNGSVTETFTVESVRGAARALIVKLAGIDNPERANRYRGWELKTGREHAAQLAEGEHYVADLCGCGVFHKGIRLGTVRSVWENSQADVLEVEIEGGEVRHVPLLDVYVGEIVPAAGRIELRVDWIVE